MQLRPPAAAHPRTSCAHRIGMLGTYPPQLCGLATFAAALEGEFVRSGRHVTIVAVDDGRTTQTPHLKRHRLHNGLPDSVVETARRLSRCDVVIVQHEYGIYGGVDGDEVIDLMRLTEAPVIVVLHTVPLRPTAHQQTVLEAVCELASAVVVMTAAAGARLNEGYRVDRTKVRIIPHGAWAPRAHHRFDQLDGHARLRLLTWGLIGPGKGIEHMIEAMALLGQRGPRVRYTVAGVTHPNVLARDGDKYRQSLIRNAWSSGVASAVRFDDTYRDVPTLRRFVASASMVVLPYDSVDQVTSGVLVDAIAAGCPVIATAFPHAVELLSDGAGMLVPHRDPGALAAAVRETLEEPSALRAMTERAQQIAPTLAWSTVADQYLALCDTVDLRATVDGAVG